MRNLLLFDEDGSRRKDIRALMDPMGYHVREAENEIIARNIFDSAPRDFNWIMAHLSPPECRGLSFLKYVAQGNTDAKFILVTEAS